MLFPCALDEESLSIGRVNPYADLVITKGCKKPIRMTETVPHGYPSETTHLELSNKYQHHRVWMVIKNLCILMLWMNVTSPLEGLNAMTKRNSKARHSKLQI